MGTLIPRDRLGFTFMIPIIRAKSDGETLEEHTIHCLEIFSQLREIFPDIDKKTGHPHFYEDVFNALFFHDFGKAAIGFQESLERKGKPWRYRHEILSVPFVDCLNVDDNDFIKTLVLTHHRDLKDLIAYAEDDLYTGPTFRDHLKEIKPNLDALNVFLKKYPEIHERFFGGAGMAVNPITSISDYGPECWENVRTEAYSWLDDEECRKFLKPIGIFGKGFVNSCDHLASGGVRNLKKPLHSLDSVFAFPEFTTVQKRCQTLRGDAIVLSPTGSGKTEASLFWATQNLNAGHGNRIFYTLPYTASINAMYRRLQKEFMPYYGGDSACVSLLHGKASYFLYRAFEDPREFRAVKDLSRKIYSPYKIMTPFQSIRHMFSLKGYEAGLLEMYQGTFILDEIHSYDPRTVGLILSMCEFLKRDLDAKILLMSATLPTFVKDLFAETLDIGNIIRMDKNELNEYLRHRCTITDGTILDNIEMIREYLSDNSLGKKKVLVVCNTVNQAQEVYLRLKDSAGSSRLLHSKFILRDREKIEREVADLDLLVGTQAIEVSLDIDYNVCFTEPAPIDALIQRFGRVNRRRKKGICDVFVFSRGSESDRYIYNQNLVQKTLTCLGEMGLLYEWELQGATDRIYNNGFGDGEKEFSNARSLFSGIINDIVPFSNSDRHDSDYYRLFNSREGVPEIFRTAYLDHIQEKEVYEAMQYTLPISNGQYYRLKHEDRISNDEGQYFIDAKYDPEVGLLIDETDPESSII